MPEVDEDKLFIALMKHRETFHSITKNYELNTFLLPNIMLM